MEVFGGEEIKKEIINSENKELNEFVFASDLFTLLKKRNEKKLNQKNFWVNTF